MVSGEDSSGFAVTKYSAGKVGFCFTVGALFSWEPAFQKLLDYLASFLSFSSISSHLIVNTQHKDVFSLLPLLSTSYSPSLC